MSEPLKDQKKSDSPAPAAEKPDAPSPAAGRQPPAEIGGRAGPEPTRYGDWEKNGLISDF